MNEFDEADEAALRRARELIEAGGLDLTDESIARFARRYPTQRIAADHLWAIPEIRYESPAVIYRAKP